MVVVVVVVVGVVVVVVVVVVAIVMAVIAVTVVVLSTSPRALLSCNVSDRPLARCARSSASRAAPRLTCPSTCKAITGVCEGVMRV